MREEQLKRASTIAGMIVMATLTFFPLVYMVCISFTTNPEFLLTSAPPGWTLSNYTDILTNRSLHFLHFLKNSFVVAGITSLFAVTSASFAAYGITRLPLPGKTTIILLVLSVSMFPQISLGGYLFKIMTSLNLMNTYTALVLPYTSWTLPLSLWILVSYFSQIPVELDNAALVDGCPRWKVLTRVILPVAAPGILSTALLVFIFAFNEFLFALMLTTDHHSRTIPVGIALFQGLHGETPWGYIMAASTVSVIPVVALTAIFQRRIISGLTEGAIKR